jgi:hypothetical protein
MQILLNANTLDQPPSMTRASNRACLAAFAAMITQIHRHENAFAGSDPDAYLQAALTLLPEIMLEPPDLRSLEAVTIMVSSSHSLRFFSRPNLLCATDALYHSSWPTPGR